MKATQEQFTDKTTASEAIRIWQNQQDEINKFIHVVRWQRDEAGLPIEDIGFHDLFCHGCDAQETSGKPESLRAFAMRVFDQGWEILSVERGHAQCPTCADYEQPESRWSAQYQQGNGGLL